MWSTNTRAYHELWLKILHRNNCHLNLNGCSEACVSGADNLTNEREACIKRGMPDLHPDLESEIWEIAFPIHALHAPDRASIVTPTWSDPIKTPAENICNCFELGMAEYNRRKDLKAVLGAPIVITEDDLWYESRFE